MRLLNFLDGKKTYLVSSLGIVVVGLWIGGAIDSDMADKLLFFLGFGGLASLRHGIMKVE